MQIQHVSSKEKPQAKQFYCKTETGSSQSKPAPLDVILDKSTEQAKGLTGTKLISWLSQRSPHLPHLGTEESILEPCPSPNPER